MILMVGDFNESYDCQIFGDRFQEILFCFLLFFDKLVHIRIVKRKEKKMWIF